MIPYVVAIAAVCVGFVLSSLLSPYTGQAPGSLLTLSIVIGALQGGIGPALSSALCASLARQVVLWHAESSLLGLDNLLQVGVFFVVAVLASAKSSRHDRAERVPEHRRRGGRNDRSVIERAERALRRERQATEALRVSEERFRTVLKGSPIVVFTQDEDLRYTWIHNPVMGLSAEDILGRRDIDLFSREEAEALDAIKREVLQTGVGVRREARFHKDSIEQFFDLTVEPLHDVSGVVVGVTCAAVDITERKWATLALRRSEERFRRLIENSNVGLIIADIHGGISYANDSFLRMLGYSRDEFERHGLRWSELTPPEFAPLDEQAVHELHDVGTFAPFEKVYMSKDGRRVPVLIGGSMLEMEPDGDRAVATFITDLTPLKRAERARHESEAQLKIALTAAQVGTLAIDTATREVRCSESAARLFGFSHGERLPFDACLERIHPADRARLLEEVERAIGAGSELSIECRLLPPEGGERWVVLRGEALPDESGSVGILIGALADITDRKRVEEERASLFLREQEARRQAEAANRAKDEFLAVLSHELRTPLTSILGWVQMMRRGRLDAEKQQRGCEVIERNAMAQARLIEDLLDVSRIISGKMVLDMKPLEVCPALSTAVEAVRPMAESKEITLACACEAHSACVNADTDRLQQVIYNLLSNAIKFTPKGGRVSARAVAKGADVVITISDTGIGIDRDLLPHLFNRFQQGDSSISRQYQGLGLGLALVRHLVEMHGGSARAESEGKGRGATFTVKLPRCESPSSPSSP